MNAVPNGDESSLELLERVRTRGLAVSVLVMMALAICTLLLGYKCTSNSKFLFGMGVMLACGFVEAWITRNFLERIQLLEEEFLS